MFRSSLSILNISVCFGIMERVFSHNVLFELTRPAETSEHPLGESVARALLEHLRMQGLEVAGPENWRDCGWLIGVGPIVYKRDSWSGTVEITIVSCRGVGTWTVQISSAHSPGMIAQLFGAKDVDRSAEIMSVARHVHRWLTDAKASSMRWKVNDDPGGPDATSVP